MLGTGRDIMEPYEQNRVLVIGTKVLFIRKGTIWDTWPIFNVLPLFPSCPLVIYSI